MLLRSDSENQIGARSLFAKRGFLSPNGYPFEAVHSIAACPMSHAPRGQHLLGASCRAYPCSDPG